MSQTLRFKSQLQWLFDLFKVLKVPQPKDLFFQDQRNLTSRLLREVEITNKVRLKAAKLHMQAGKAIKQVPIFKRSPRAPKSSWSSLSKDSQSHDKQTKSTTNCKSILLSLEDQFQVLILSLLNEKDLSEESLEEKKIKSKQASISKLLAVTIETQNRKHHSQIKLFQSQIVKNEQILCSTGKSLMDLPPNLLEICTLQV